MPRWFKIFLATALPLIAGALAWIICATNGTDGNTTGIVVSLVVLIPVTPIGIWAGQLNPAIPTENRTRQ